MSEHEEALAHIAVLAKQLAAERFKREREMADYETLCHELREQLAAEREKADEYLKQAIELEAQLAAERFKKVSDYEPNSARSLK